MLSNSLHNWPCSEIVPYQNKETKKGKKTRNLLLTTPTLPRYFKKTARLSARPRPSTEGGSVNKENPQQTFSVVVVVWISITVLPVKIVNLKNDHSRVKTN